MRKYFFIAILTTLSFQLRAGILDSLSVYLGAGGGYENSKTLRGEVYGKVNLHIFNMNIEYKAGINNRSYQLEFDHIKNLNAQSVGFFNDIAIYPFKNGLFAGFRWETADINWLTSASRSKIESQRTYSAPYVYSGTCLFFQAGYSFRLSDKMNLKLYAQPGFQEFTISNGSTTSGSYSSSDDNLIIEDHVKFIYNINLSLEFKLR